MSLFDCVQRAMDDDTLGIDKGRGQEAQGLFRDLVETYQRQGRDQAMAEALAAEDVKAAFKKKAADERHVTLAKLSNLRKQQAEVAAAAEPDMRKTMERLDYRQRGLVRRFNGRLGAFLKEHHRDIAGRLKNPAGMRNIVRELHGEASGDATAKALADGVRAALEDMRLMANEAGATIGKLDNSGLPHSHNKAAIRRAGFDAWFGDISPRIDWTKMEDRLTGKPFQEGTDAPPEERQRALLNKVYENIVFGKDVEEPKYGRGAGSSTANRMSESRVLTFRSADEWIDYNKRFGSGDPFKSLMGHVNRMARDISLMREFGPNPTLGANYRAQLWEARTGKTGFETQHDKAIGDTAHGLRMFKVLAGGRGTQTARQDWVATFFSNTRHIMTSAMLDRAIIASMSDMNTMRLAAQSMGMSPANVVAKQVGAVRSLSREDMLRAGWVADTMADPGTALARFQQEIAPSEVAERLSSAAMRVQGLSAWTDRSRSIFYQEFSGLYAANAGRALDEVEEPLRSLMRRHNITADDWAAFTDPEHMFTAGNGATFAMPIWWREATTLPARRADEVFDKFQGLLEEQLEVAVPSGSLLARGIFDPSAYDLPPGSVPYEILKSATMFKSFTMTFAVSQYRQIMMRPTIPGRIGYALNLAAGATVMGALALQVGDMLLGRDPQDMTDPSFWVRASMKGGAFGIVGDIISTGSASWGGGFPSYVAGPMWQGLQDVYGLTAHNAFQLAMGEDTGFAKELARFGKRYTPMGQTVAIGPALDRLFWDQLQLWLDPGSVDAMAQAARARQNAYGSGDFWAPGSPLPSRAPDLSNALGG